MLGQEKTCNRLKKREGYCDYHTKQKVKSFPCMSCRKGTRSSLGMCKGGQCNHEKLRYKKKKINKVKEAEKHIIIKHYKKILFEEPIKKVKTIY